ncbi:phosphoglycolate phosphatase [Tropicimonas sp. S265A]|uniref:phosphoglycolate phosphatase n=1 Tax=Tropicimonas sp. S265A TaxID=3415134 RepID=UPI003C7D4F74
MSRRFDAVVFDLDGTLVDSAPDMAAALNAALAEVGLDPFSLGEVISFVGSGGRILVRRALAARGARDLDETEMLGRFITQYEGKLDGQTQSYPGVMAMLARLQEAGVPMGLCTNKPEGPARGVCAALGLDTFMPVIVGGDTLPVLKPDPAPLLHVCRALRVMPEATLYVGDSETDYVTAQAARTPFAFVEGGYQSRPIRDFAPTFTLKSPALVAELVLG